MLRKQQLFQRYEGNPILSWEQWPHIVNAVFNPAAVTFEGETLLLVRVEDRSGISHLNVARSSDGFTDWRIEAEPSFRADMSDYNEAWGSHLTPPGQAAERFV